MIDISFLPQDFRKAILDAYPKNISLEYLCFDTKSEIALVIQNERVEIIGCKLCLTNKVKQEYFGTLLIKGQKLIEGKNKTEFKFLPQEILNNIYLCPHCQKPFKDRMIKLCR